MPFAAGRKSVADTVVLLKNSVLADQWALVLLTLASLAQVSPKSSGGSWFLRKRHSNRGRYRILPNTCQAIRLRSSVWTPCSLKKRHQRLLKNRRFLNLWNLPSHLNKHQQLLSPPAQAEMFHPASSGNILAHLSTGPHPGLRRLMLRPERSGNAVLPAPESQSRGSVVA